jgi:hypothetical protein
MRRVSLLIGVAVMVLTAGAAEAQQPAAQQPCPAPRKINVGVAVAPPNVVHTAPYVAKALGFFAKHCVDANIIQFDGGAAGTAVTAVGQGTAISNLPDSAIAQGLKARQVWGLAPRSPHAYVVPGDIKTAADLKGRRLSAAGGVGGLNWLLGREVLRSAGLKVEDAQFISQGTAGLPGFVAGQIEASRFIRRMSTWSRSRSRARNVLIMVADSSRNSVQSLRRRRRDDCQGPRPRARHHRGHDRSQSRDLSRQGQGRPDHRRGHAETQGRGRIRIDVLTKNCVLSVNEGFLRDRIEDAPEQHRQRRHPAREETELRSDRRFQARFRRGRGRRMHQHQRLQGLGLAWSKTWMAGTSPARDRAKVD